MTTTQEALKLCLRVLRPIAGDRVYETRWLGDAISAAEEALEQQEQEPVAWMYVSPEGSKVDIFEKRHKHLIYKTEIPLYTHPAKQLSDDEIASCTADGLTDEYDLKFARAIEAKIRGE